MGKNTWDKTKPVDRLDEATDETHCTLAQRIMSCGMEVACMCSGKTDVSPLVMSVVNSSIVDCVADCIDILRGDKRNASVNNR